MISRNDTTSISQHLVQREKHFASWELTRAIFKDIKWNSNCLSHVYKTQSCSY